MLHYSCVGFPQIYIFWRWIPQINCPLVLSCSINIINPSNCSHHHHKALVNVGKYGSFSHGAPPCTYLLTRACFSQAFSPSICITSLPLGSVGSCESQELPSLPRDILDLARGLQWAVKGGEGWWNGSQVPDMEVNLSQLVCFRWRHQAINVDPGLLNHEFDRGGTNF